MEIYITTETGQEDIESLEKSIKMHAKRLPIERMDVSNSTLHLFVIQAQMPT